MRSKNAQLCSATYIEHSPRILILIASQAPKSPTTAKLALHLFTESTQRFLSTDSEIILHGTILYHAWL